MYKISEETKRMLLDWLTRGSASNLPFKDVWAVLQTLQALEPLEESNKKHGKEK